MLNLRPEERRLLIEEAADIQRYRLKIEEAQDRLKATHENVERVKLLMKEIAPRLAQLERQAQRAGEHARLSTELHQALQVYYENQWHRSQESLAVARANHDQAQAEFMQAKVALETCQREVVGYQEAAGGAAAGDDRLRGRARAIGPADPRSRAATGCRKERRAILEARAGELEEEIGILEEERTRASGLISSEDETARRLEEEVSAAREAFEARQADVRALEEEFREALTHGADAEARGKRLQAGAAEIKTRVTAAGGIAA